MKLWYPSWPKCSTGSNLLVQGLCKLLLIYSFPAATANFAQESQSSSSISDTCINGSKCTGQQGRTHRNEGHQMRGFGWLEPVLCNASAAFWKPVHLTYSNTLWGKDQLSVSTALLHSAAGGVSQERAKPEHRWAAPSWSFEPCSTWCIPQLYLHLWKLMQWDPNQTVLVHGLPGLLSQALQNFGSCWELHVLGWAKEMVETQWLLKQRAIGIWSTNSCDFMGDVLPKTWSFR